MRRRMVAVIALGGVVGATCRWAALEAWPTGTHFPWTVFAVNAAGSFVVGIALAEEARHPTWDLWVRGAVGIGFCGGLTTFSTFAVETAGFLRDDRVALGLSYAVASVVVSIVAAVAGAATRRRVGALSLALEGPGDDR